MPATPSPSKSVSSTSIVLGVFFALCAIFVFEAFDSHASFHIELGGLGDRVRLNLHDDGERLRLERDGTVIVAEDGRIERANPGARLELEDRSRRRSLEVVGAEGDPAITYREGREVRPFDADARAWLAGAMLVAYRRGGLDAERRAADFLARGVDALVEEASHIDSDHVARLYLEPALGIDSTATELAAILDVAARRIDSDHAQMVLLREVPARRLGEPEVLAAYVRAASTIASDYNLRQTLAPALESTPDPGVVAALLGVAADELGSDHEATQLLLAWIDDGEVRAPLPDAAFDLLDSIDSDFELRRVAVELAHVLPTAEMPRLVDRVDTLGSDHERSQFLLAVIDRHRDVSGGPEQDALRAAIERSTRRIAGDHARQRVTLALAGE